MKPLAHLKSSFEICVRVTVLTFADSIGAAIVRRHFDCRRVAGHSLDVTPHTSGTLNRDSAHTSARRGRSA
jgi:hypothetical protein